MRTGQFVVQVLLVLPVLNLHLVDLLWVLGFFPVELEVDKTRTCHLSVKIAFILNEDRNIFVLAFVDSL